MKKKMKSMQNGKHEKWKNEIREKYEKHEKTKNISKVFGFTRQILDDFQGMSLLV